MRHLLAVTAIAAAFTVSVSVSASAATIDLTSLNVAGTARQVGNGVQLTNFSGPNYQSGAAWLAQGISTTQSFSTSFAFSLKGDDSGKMADGIALAFQNAGNNVTGNAGGDVGFWDIGRTGASAVGSVVRSWDNNEYGLSTNGVVQGLKKTGWNLGASNNVTGTQTVSYDAATHVLSMTGSFTDITSGRNYSVSDVATVDLSAKFGNTMYVGFTGATGGTDADQRITSFSMSSLTSAVPEADTYAMLLAGLGLVGFAGRRRKPA